MQGWEVCVWGLFGFFVVAWFRFFLNFGVGVF